MVEMGNAKSGDTVCFKDVKQKIDIINQINNDYCIKFTGSDYVFSYNESGEMVSIEKGDECHFSIADCIKIIDIEKQN